LDKDNNVVDDKKFVPPNEADKKRTSQMEQNETSNIQKKKVDGVIEDANKENSSATGNMAIDAMKEANMPNIQSKISDSMSSKAVNDDNQQQSLKIQSMLQ